MLLSFYIICGIMFSLYLINNPTELLNAINELKPNDIEEDMKNNDNTSKDNSLTFMLITILFWVFIALFLSIGLYFKRRKIY